MRKLLVVLFSFTTLVTNAQADHSHRLARALRFPDIPGFKSLKCDLHMHTVFSDGSVWPDIRVAEALWDGLDAISLTEHLEYQPHKEDIPHPDRNRSYQIALQEAKNHDLLIIHGSEITRKMPPGHSNALFIKDANKMLISDSVEVFREAKRQGAFTFWNHPHWTSQRRDGIATLTDMHRFLIREKLLDGIEVVNDRSYSDESLRIALDNNLTIMAGSDVHKLVDHEYKVAEGGHRPITIVFAKEKTIEAVQEGLQNRRTVVFYNNLLIGRDEWLVPLLEASLKIKSAKYPERNDVAIVEIENLTSCDFILQNKTSYTLHDHADVITIKAGEVKTIRVKTVNRLDNLELKWEVLSAVNAPNRHPQITLKAALTK
jgi:predicted metal-dependent phosphoesterase TrpH